MSRINSETDFPTRNAAQVASTAPKLIGTDNVGNMRMSPGQIVEAGGGLNADRYSVMSGYDDLMPVVNPVGTLIMPNTASPDDTPFCMNGLMDVQKWLPAFPYRYVHIYSTGHDPTKSGPRMWVSDELLSGWEAATSVNVPGYTGSATIPFPIPGFTGGTDLGEAFSLIYFNGLFRLYGHSSGGGGQDQWCATSPDMVTWTMGQIFGSDLSAQVVHTGYHYTFVRGGRVVTMGSAVTRPFVRYARYFSDDGESFQRDRTYYLSELTKYGVFDKAMYGIGIPIRLHGHDWLISRLSTIGVGEDALPTIVAVKADSDGFPDGVPREIMTPTEAGATAVEGLVQSSDLIESDDGKLYMAFTHYLTPLPSPVHNVYLHEITFAESQTKPAALTIAGDYGQITPLLNGRHKSSLGRSETIIQEVDFTNLSSAPAGVTVTTTGGVAETYNPASGGDEGYAEAVMAASGSIEFKLDSTVVPDKFREVWFDCDYIYTSGNLPEIELEMGGAYFFLGGAEAKIGFQVNADVGDQTVLEQTNISSGTHYASSLSLGLVRTYKNTFNSRTNENYFAVLKNRAGELIAVHDITTDMGRLLGGVGAKHRDSPWGPRITFTGDSGTARIGRLATRVVRAE